MEDKGIGRALRSHLLPSLPNIGANSINLPYTRVFSHALSLPWAVHLTWQIQVKLPGNLRDGRNLSWFSVDIASGEEEELSLG